IRRTAEVMAANTIEDPAAARTFGVIDLDTMQRYLNFHFSVTMDLFGSEVSSNAATYYTSGLKGRFEETRISDDHVLTDALYEVFDVEGGRLVRKQVPAL